MPRFRRSRETTERARALRRSPSKSEALLWLHLRGSALGVRFRRQHPIGPYFADYCCLRRRLVVEVDGPDHDEAHDARRDAFMAGQGFRVVRFSTEAVTRETEGVVDVIRHALEARDATPTHPSPLQGEDAH
jgi:very-short-patch-repair endonuclease